MTHPNAARRGLLAIAVLAALLAPVAVAEAITLPSGFADEQVMTIDSPMALAFTPDGRMLIAAKHGTLHVYTTSGALKTALDLTAKACTNIERGVLGVAVDPAFATNHYVYVFYTLNKFNNSCPVSAAQTPVGRVSRFVLGNDNVVSAASETVLIDNIPSYGGHHDAGDVQFGKDGNLYVSTGDGYCDYAGGGCEGLNDASRDEHVLVGKILRITPSGAIPPDNPFTGLGTARCNLAGRTNPGMRCQETYAWGLRNPFRIAFDPNAAGTRLYIDDVGQAVWDEIDEGVAGADYGWNTREGHCANGSSTDCGAPPAGMTNPIFDYGHGDLCSSITGGAFVPNDAWPPPYAGTYLFGDYACGKIFQLVPKAGGGFERLEFVSGLGANSAVHLTFGPDGALYYTNFVGTGTIHRIVRNTGNRPPIADLAATPTSGATPLTVSFDASLSSDPDAGDALTYLWDFGDATPATQTSVPTTSHAYTTAGTFTATLTVRDDHALASAPDTLRIDPGNDPPVVTIGSPSSGQRAAVGDTILLRGGATDPQDGALPDSALSWTVIRHHASHTHPFLGPVGGNAQSFVAPPPEDLSATTNSSLEVRLTATDSHGVTSTAARTVAPKLVDLAFASNPTGLSLLLDGFTFTAPRTWTSWEGWDVVAGAPSQGSFAFGSWSDGGAGTHAIHTPAAPAAYTASFVASGAGNLVVNPSFEASLSGWGSFHGSLSRVAVGGAPDGGWVARATRATGTNYSVGDNEGTAPTVPSVTAGTTYVASCYVRAANAQSSGRPGRIVLRERAGSFGTVAKETAASFTLSTTFKRVSVAAVAVTSGHTMGLRCEQTSAVAGDAFEPDLMTVARATTVGGNTTAGTVWTNATANVKRASAMTLTAPREIVALQAYLDGKAASSGSQPVRGVLYSGTPTGPTTRVATTNAVTISAGKAAGWVKLAFAAPVRLAAGSYWIALHTGGSSAVLRYAAQAVSGALRTNADSYGDGAAATYGSATTESKSLSLYAVGAWMP